MGRLCRIIYDSDVCRKPSVRDALDRLVALLERRGAIVEVVYLPEGADGAKVGLDDFKVAGGTVAELDALARPWSAEPPRSALAPDDLDEVAQLRRELDETKAALRLERTLRMEEHAVLGDSSRPAQERICAVKLQWEARRVARHETIAAGSGSVVAIDEIGAIHLNVKRLAEISGTSPKHAGACLKTWEDAGWIARSVTRHRIGTEEEITTGGEIKPRYESICRIRPRRDLDHMLEDFLTLAPRVAPKPTPKPKAHCKEHPDADIIRRTTTTCSVCREEVQPERVSQHKVGDPALNAPEVISETAPRECPPSPGPYDLLSHLGLLQNEPAGLPEVPEPEEDVITYGPPDLGGAREVLASADRTGNRVALEDLRAQLEPIARARGRVPVPKPGSVAGDDPWTW